MTVEELRDLCGGRPGVYLTLTRAALPRGAKTRLLGRAGPLGWICTAKEAGGAFQVVAYFESAEVLRWLDQNA